MLANHFEDKPKCSTNAKDSVKKCRSVFPVQGDIPKTSFEWGEGSCKKSPHQCIQRKTSKLPGCMKENWFSHCPVCYVLDKYCWAKQLWTVLSQPCEKKSKRKQTCNMRSPLVFMTIGFGYLLSLYSVCCTEVCLAWPIAIPMSSEVLILHIFKICCVHIDSSQKTTMNGPLWTWLRG